MANIFLTNQSELQNSIEKSIQKKMKKVFSQGKFLLNAQAEVLRNIFANSEEFQSLKGKFKGEFGFTDEEVANLDRILTLLVPGNSEITVTKIKTVGQFVMTLEWVDFRKLKAHEFALHNLTQLDEMGQVIDITDTISWVEWLEEGATARGYQFFRPSQTRRSATGTNPAAFSRSGEGLMKSAQGNFWVFEPTRIFERIGKGETGDFLKKGFGLLVKKFAK